MAKKGTTKPRLPLIGLVMIVKNEEQQLARALASALPLIGSWTICDTGSTDATKNIVRGVLGHLPGRLYDHKWRDFGHNLNLALARARGSAQWLLRLDADMEVSFVNDNLLKWLGKDPDKKLGAWDLEVLDHGMSYRLPLLVRGDQQWRYVGATHEYLDAEGRRQRPLLGLQITHHGQEGDRSDKLLRDIELLKPAFKKGEPRAVFYTAECYRYLGNYGKAIEAYGLRAALGGFEEERWYATYQSAFLRKDLEGLIDVWRERPWRHEPLSALARIISGVEHSDKLFLEAFGRPTQPLP